MLKINAILRQDRAFFKGELSYGSISAVPHNEAGAISENHVLNQHPEPEGMLHTFRVSQTEKPRQQIG
jgi:hypothetical protein